MTHSRRCEVDFEYTLRHQRYQERFGPYNAFVSGTGRIVPVNERVSSWRDGARSRGTVSAVVQEGAVWGTEVCSSIFITVFQVRSGLGRRHLGGQFLLFRRGGLSGDAQVFALGIACADPLL